MKSLSVVIIIICLFSISCSNDGSVKNKNSEKKKETTETAVKYNDLMVAIHKEVEGPFTNLLNAMESQSYQEMLMAKEDALLTNEAARVAIDAYDNFDGSDEFKKELLKLIAMYDEIIAGELSEMIEMDKTGEMSAEELEIYNELFSQALDKYDVSFNEFAVFQKNFAKKWNFELEETIE